MTTRFTLRSVPLAELTANPANVRQFYNDLDELANSIRVHGILQPLIVNEKAGRLVVTDGHRRLEAARRACVPLVPCLVTAAADDKSVTATMLAAAMHQQLRPIEQARAFRALQGQGLTTVEIARVTGYRLALVKSRLLLLDLPLEAQDMVEDGSLTVTEAVPLARQVRRSKTGTAATKRPKTGGDYWRRHPLLVRVETLCDHQETRVTLGGTGCAHCWESVIREDERAKRQAVPA